MRVQFWIISLVILGAQSLLYWQFPGSLWTYAFTLPLFLLGVFDTFQYKHTLIRNYPIVGRLRYVMEKLRPKIYQYFVESDIDGAPINRNIRSVVYQRAKQELDTSPFGTQENVYQTGYEWINHSMNPVDFRTIDHNLRIMVGNKDCRQPYSLSLLNISAMSYGALSQNAIAALNAGAAKGNFAHNTGEGGISPFHKRYKGDLIWQIGTGYFGCRDLQGNFNPDMFRENANLEQVKMIEIKLSQGAKPGHGGILPAAKNTVEIAEIRGVTPGTNVFSPSCHTTFNNHHGLIDFIIQLRDLSGGKPIGFKMCLGHKEEFISLCETLKDRHVYPDYIVVDGGEGGTGAAPLEFANFIGTPLQDALAFVYDCLASFGIKEHIKIGASGKLFTGFDLAKSIALGADFCYTARGMMLALGCIQALECNSNNCPTGIATQNKSLMAGLDVEDKALRVFNYHRETLVSLSEIIAAAGLRSTKDLTRHFISKRVSPKESLTFAELFPYGRDYTHKKKVLKLP